MARRPRHIEIPTYLILVLKPLFALIVANGIGLVSLLSIVPANIANEALLKTVYYGMILFVMGFLGAIFLYMIFIQLVNWGDDLQKIQPKSRNRVGLFLLISACASSLFAIGGLIGGILFLLRGVRNLAFP